MIERLGLVQKIKMIRQFQPRKMQSKRFFARGLQYNWDLTFPSILHIPMDLIWLIARFDLNSHEKVILCRRHATATYMFSDISLEYDTIFGKRYVTAKVEWHAAAAFIPYINITSISYQTLSKKTLLGKLNLITCLFVHYMGFCY